MATRSRSGSRRGVSADEAREMLSRLDGVAQGRAYGQPSYLLGGKFMARFRDHDTVLVLRLRSIDDRDVLMALDPQVFFFTDHYRNYPAVLVRLAAVPRDLLADLITQAGRATAALKPAAKSAAGKSRRIHPRKTKTRPAKR